MSDVYTYTDQHGNAAFYRERVVMKKGKQFVAWHPVEGDAPEKYLRIGAAQYPVAKGIPSGSRHLIYQLPEVLAAVVEHDESDEIWLPEGERDVETLRALGVVASTGHGGAGKWGDAQAAWLEGYAGTVVVLVDNDAPGAAEGVLKWDALNRLGVRVEILAAPTPHKDVSDLFAAGGELEDLEAVEIGELREQAVEGVTTPNAGWVTYGLSRQDRAHLTNILRPAAASAEVDVEELTELAGHIRRERMRRLATKKLDAEEALAEWEAPPSYPHMGEELDLEELPIDWTVEGMHERGTNTLIVATFKAGKTVLALNLICALVDHGLFLGFKTCFPEDGRRVAWWNYELTENQARRWVRELGLEHPERVTHLPLRGYSMPLQAEQIVEWAVGWLRDHNIKVWIIDPFAEAYDGDENDNSLVRVWLQNLNEIKRRAGVEDVWLIAHTGHGEAEEGRERARGASRLEGWKDTGWYYTKHPETDDMRFLRAFGRDVDQANVAVRFHSATRRLAVDENASGQTRAELVARSKSDHVAQLVAQQPGIKKGDLRAKLGRGANPDKDRWIALAVERGLVRTEEGKQRAIHHLPVDRPSITFNAQEDE